MVTSAQCIKRFGNPSLAANEAKYMELFDVPASLEIGVIPKKVYCNKLLIIPLSNAFKNLIDRKLVDELKTWDGCFNVRNKRGLSSWSLHAWGLAVDVNASWNQLHRKPTLSAAFVKCFTDAGFDWGGNWPNRVDGMHFQLAKLPT